MKKSLIFLILVSLIFIFNKIIISKVIIFGFSKLIKKDLVAEKIDINYLKNELVLHSIEIKNSSDYYFKNIIEVDLIKIVYNFNSIFSNLRKIYTVDIENLKLYLEFEVQDKKISEDSLGLTKIIKNKDDSKIYPIKKKDKNFIILKTNFFNSKVYLKNTNTKKITEIKLSDMKFSNIGNEKKSQHYKDVFKIIFRDIYFRVPDNKLKKLIKKAYKL